MQNETVRIHEYVRERRTGKGKQIVGVIVGFLVGDTARIGWSKTNLDAGDVFDKNRGIRIAYGRAVGWQKCPALPPQMIKQMDAFKKRCERYFQQAKYIVHPSYQNGVMFTRHPIARDWSEKLHQIIQGENEENIDILINSIKAVTRFIDQFNQSC